MKFIPPIPDGLSWLERKLLITVAIALYVWFWWVSRPDEVIQGMYDDEDRSLDDRMRDSMRNDLRMPPDDSSARSDDDARSGEAE